MILVVDYGMGNLDSVAKALEKQGGRVRISCDHRDFKKADKVVLPGVGAFKDAMVGLKKRELLKPIVEKIYSGGVFLGICLGMQLLFETSQENPGIKGIRAFKGRVKKFTPSLGVKIPQMGWNRINIVNSASPLFRGIRQGEYVYFAHSYYCVPKEKGIISTTTDYGVEFASSISAGNVFGVQFHPEKSQSAGLKILKNFVKL